jgi:type II secretory pathway predicted ATPase ExeA
LFLEPYRLATNPFSADRLHPVQRSLSYEYSARKIAQLVEGKLHCLFISGPSGVGKTLLLEKELQTVDGVDICRLTPGHKDADSILWQLLKDIGPGPVAGTATELRNILHVFLRHQAARGRRCLVIADAVDRESLAVVKEIEALVQIRLRGVPAVHSLLTTSNEELVTQFQNRNESGARIGWHHQRHTGFTLEETEAYLRSSLLGAGCEWFDELIPGELVFEIQSFTQGIVGNIDALLRESMDELARVSTDSIRQKSLDVGILKSAAKKLRLRYDAAAWKVQHEEVLLPSAVRQSRREALRIESATLAVSSGGRRIAEVTLNRPRMVLGRDASCDISLDSHYVSRYQNLFMETQDGWMLIDLNSTNGCFVNGRRVHEHRLKDGDLISLGQHQLRFSGANHEPGVAADKTMTAVALNPNLPQS